MHHTRPEGLSKTAHLLQPIPPGETHPLKPAQDTTNTTYKQRNGQKQSKAMHAHTPRGTSRSIYAANGIQTGQYDNHPPCTHLKLGGGPQRTFGGEVHLHPTDGTTIHPTSGIKTYKPRRSPQEINDHDFNIQTGRKMVREQCKLPPRSYKRRLCRWTSTDNDKAPTSHSKTNIGTIELGIRTPTSRNTTNVGNKHLGHNRTEHAGHGRKQPRER